MDDLIRKLSEIRSEYNCFNQDEEPYYRALSEVISILSRRTDGDTISRQAAIDAIEGTDWYHINKNGVLVQGANSETDIPLYKADDVYNVLTGLPSAERWIPVTERLPEDEGQYLVSCDTDYGVEVGRFYIDEDGERYFGCDWNDPEDIEAWMPLPEPYKGGAEE